MIDFIAQKSRLRSFQLGAVLLVGIIVLLCILWAPEEEDLDEYLYDAKFESRTISGKPCLTKGKSKPRILASMQRNATASDVNSQRTLVLINYFETARAQGNIEFFLEHGIFVREDVDWLFVANSHMCLDVPEHESIGVLFRDNTCYDLGTYKEVILKFDFANKYRRIVTMNASVRGPFMPIWSTECWLDKLLAPLQGNTKVVSTTVNCQRLDLSFSTGPFWNQRSYDSRVHRPHMQSMLLAMDRDAVLPLVTLYRCFDEKFDAIFEGESRNLMRLQAHNYSIFSLYSEFYKDSKDWKQCHHSAPDSIHPYEVIFIKVVSTVVPDLVEATTLSVDRRPFRSKQFCIPPLYTPEPKGLFKLYT